MEFIVSLFCVLLDLALCIHSYYLLNSKKIKLPLFYTCLLYTSDAVQTSASFAR